MMRKIEYTNQKSFRLCIPKDWMQRFNAMFNNGKIAKYAKLEFYEDGSFKVIPLKYGVGENEYNKDRYFAGCCNSWSVFDQ